MAAALATKSNVADMDSLLEPLLGRVPYTPTLDRLGNSLEDLRLSAFGYGLGMLIRSGGLNSNRDVANWIARYISAGY